MGVIASVAKGVGDLLTGGAISARKARKRAKREEERAEQEMLAETEAERARRRSIQRAALQRQPSLYDMLGGPKQ